MSSSLTQEQQLWSASTCGNLGLVRLLTLHPAVNVNWIGPEKGDTPLHRACRFGHVPVVEFLLKHKQVDVNAGNARQATPFIIACQEGHNEVVSLLQADTRTDVNKPQLEGCTPFFVACATGNHEMVSLLQADLRVDVNRAKNTGSTPFFFACMHGHKKVVSQLLADKRLEVNKPKNDQCTPLWIASQNGHLPVVQLILVYGRDVNTKTKSIAGTMTWNNKTAAEMARCQGTILRDEDESEEEYSGRKHNGPLIAALIDSFEADPATTRQQLRELPELRDPFIGDLFALVIFLCEGLLSVGAESSTSNKAVRFFRIAQALPMELQMVLCNRVFGSGKDHVLTKHSEPAFKKLGSLFH